MMGRQISDQASFFYEFRLDDRTPSDHLLRRINRFLTPVLLQWRHVQRQLHLQDQRRAAQGR